MPQLLPPLLILVLLFAILFDYTNGFHDAANAIATSVSTQALTPATAVLMAATLNFVGALISTEVALTLGKGIVVTQIVTMVVVLAALIGAITWNFITWRFGLPTSSSHALTGGLVGAAIAKAGLDGVQWDGLIEKFMIPTLLAPVIGLVIGVVFIVIIYWVFRHAQPARLQSRFRLAQTASAAFMAFSHGSNDAQKTMGVMTLALVAGGVLPAANFHVPIWVILVSASAMAAGTLVGGWRIIRTVGGRIVKIAPAQGFAAETSAGAVLLATAHLGFPVSTTHVITGAIMGAGGVGRVKAVRWGVAGSILGAWLITLPAAGLVAAAAYLIVRVVFGP
ncbi:MAG TPA: inorganic phosphate transporter [Candidatus Limnocylindrales bacterium]|nr:inorganic phosphate transporter [Candidatus Limnocylindrales bacterium]